MATAAEAAGHPNGRGGSPSAADGPGGAPDGALEAAGAGPDPAGMEVGQPRPLAPPLAPPLKLHLRVGSAGRVDSPQEADGLQGNLPGTALPGVGTVRAPLPPLPAALLPAVRAQLAAFRLLRRGAPVPAGLLDSAAPAPPTTADPFPALPARRARAPPGLPPRDADAARTRVAARVAELEALPAALSAAPFADDPALWVSRGPAPSLPPGSSAKMRAVIELKALRLLDRQRRLREEVARCMLPPGAAALADRRLHALPFRRKPADVRQPLVQSRGGPAGDRREKITQADFLASVCAHGREVREAAAGRRDWLGKLGAQVQKMHVQIEKDEAARIEMERSERLRALRENDEETYLRLVKESKDTRVQHIMQQTNDFLRKLTDKVAQQQETVDMDEPESPVEDGAVTTRDKEKSDFYGLAHRIVEPVTRQPRMLRGGELKEYQLKGLQWMVSLYNNKLNGILADEMGLGKTIQTISLLAYLYETKKQRGPFLIIVPLSTMTNWSYELEKWAPDLRTVMMKGTKIERKNISNTIRMGQFDVVLTTFEYIVLEKALLGKVKWVHMIIDEGHRMKNAGSKLVQTLTQFYTSRYRLILTGTPLQNNLPELWALLNFICPKIFASVKTFDEWFNSPFAGGGEKVELNEEESLLIIRRLHQVLRPFLLRRLKKDVASDLPDKVEKVIRCGMSALQKRLYDQISKYGFLPTEKDERLKRSGKSLNNPLMHLRKVCNHPYAFPEVENYMNPKGGANIQTYRVSGKFELLDRILPKLFRTGHRVLMFFQMKEEMNVLEDYMIWRGWKWLRLDGNSKGEIREEALSKFNAADSEYNLFILTTRAGGLGLNLQAADTVIIFDSDWNPHQDLQAQDRAHRIGQKKQVLVLRLITSGTVEEEIQDRAHFKLDMDGKVIQAGKFDDKSTAMDRENVLKAVMERARIGAHTTDMETETGDEELNDILQRSEEELEVFRQLDVERAAADERDWAEIGGPPKPSLMHERLMTDEEVPEIYRIEHPPQDEAEKIIEETGRGHRARKEVVYDDGLTEKQFLDAVEKAEEEAEGKKKRKRKRGTVDVQDPHGLLRKKQKEAVEGSAAGSVVGDDDRHTKEGSEPPASSVSLDMDDTTSVSER
ncbi:SNF2 family N-terminal domain-containing protein [Hyaloraphidium curvatum]|nr:SNF2 family N-terminal domain-containing protein [Hyaloraphidium curvatum]